MNPHYFHIAITAIVLIGVLYLFVREKLPAHVTAMGAMAVLLCTGTISTTEALAVFSNSAPITIAAMFIMGAALLHTGVIDGIGTKMLRLAERSRMLAITALLGGVLFTSAFINNTPVVVVMAPVVIAVARKLRESPSKYLIPLSYAAILGGTCTLIGTSTNLLVDGLAQANGQPAFSMFEITLPGVIMAIVGALFLATVGRKLLPERELLEEQLANPAQRKRFLAEALIVQGSPLIGKTLNEVHFSEREQYEIIDLVRHDTGTRYVGLTGFMEKMSQMLGDKQEGASGRAVSTLRDIPLLAGDKLVFKTDKEELLEIRKQLGITFDTEDMHIPQPFPARETVVIEGTIDAKSSFVGRAPASLRLRRRYGSYILAIHRGANARLHLWQSP